MSSPWKVLRLPPDSTLQEVKAAYAKLLREHRPDVDPEGFRTLRDAYEWVRDRLATRDARSSLVLPPVQPDELAATEPERASPSVMAIRQPRPRRPQAFARRWQRAIDRARAADAQRSEHRLLRLLVARWCHAESRAADLDQVLASELQRVSAPVRVLVPVEAAVAAIENGEFAVPLQLLRSHLTAGYPRDIEPLVSALELATSRDVGGKGAAHIENLAMEIAVLHAVVAERLANALFRAHAVTRSELERRLIAGRELAKCSLDDRCMLTRVLFDPEVGEEHELVARATEFFRRLHQSKPVALELFRRRFPKIELPRTRPSRAVVANTSGRRRRSTNSKGSGLHLGAVLILIALVRVLIEILAGKR